MMMSPSVLKCIYILLGIVCFHTALRQVHSFSTRMPPLIAQQQHENDHSNRLTQQNDHFLFEPSRQHVMSSTNEPQKHHPTFYEDSPSFQGPLILDSQTLGQRIRHYSQNEIRNNKNHTATCVAQHVYYTQVAPKILSSSSVSLPSTQIILQTIVHALIYYNVPIDVKEVVESMEFVLRSKKRLIHATKQNLAHSFKLYNASTSSTTCNTTIHLHVTDLCAGHGLTGLLLAACLYHQTSWIHKTTTMITTVLHLTLVDSRESLVFSILVSILTKICPWMSQVSIQFVNQSLNEYFDTRTLQYNTPPAVVVTEQGASSSSSSSSSLVVSAHMVVAIHACGSLTDQVLQWATQSPIQAAAIAVMPCCYTGTDVGMPYGLQRALGVSWNADIRRALFLQQQGYHVDLGCIPREITPMNRILFGEWKNKMTG